MLLMATDEGYVCVVRLSDKKTLCDFFGNGKMYKLFWSADDKVVYTGTESGNFRATEAATGKLLWQKYIEVTIFGWAMTDDTVITSTTICPKSPVLPGFLAFYARLIRFS